MSRHPRSDADATSTRNLRLGALLLVFIGISQVYDPLVDPTLSQELWYWSVRVAALALGLWSADALVARCWTERWRRPPWLRPVVVVSALGLLPFALVELVMEPHLPMRPEYSDDELWAYSPPLAYLSEYATVLSILLPAHLLLWLLLERRGPASDGDGAPSVDGAEDDAAQAANTPSFLHGSEVARAEDVIAFRAEEHYVRVFTGDGQVLIHYRFGDAVKEMPAPLGLRVHRSWWVAGEAVVGASRGARRWQLQLQGDLQVPVSDSYVQAVRERGWLQRKRRGAS